MANFLTKQQVIADFKVNFLPHLIGEDIEFIKQMWLDNLAMLLSNKRISKKQKETWIFPKKDLEL